MRDGTRRAFAAILSAMDDAVGRVLAKLRELNLEENSLIFFLSDNGGPTDVTTSKNDLLRGRKATTSEGGIRVPFMVQWKGKVAAGKVYHHPVIQLDILPTAISAAGTQLDPNWKIDGVNLLPYLTGEETSAPHQTLYWRIGQQWAIRHGDWKLVVSRVDGSEPRLINLVNDPGESNDLSTERPDKVKELKALWDSWNAEQAEPRWRSRAAE